MAILLPNDYISTLPSAYQELEYIESTGTQYIDTGINCDANVSCDTVVSFTKIDSGYFLGAYVGGHGHYIVRVGDGAYTYDSHAVGSPWATVNKKHSIRSQMWSGDQKFIVDGVTKFTSTYSSTMNNNRPLYLFCSNDIVDGAYAKCWAKLYSMKIYHSNFNNVVRDYVPAKRKSDGVVGLYEKVSGGFYTNKGSGTFLYKEIPTMIDVENVIYNGVILDKVIFDGVVVWENWKESTTPITKSIKNTSGGWDTWYDFDSGWIDLEKPIKNPSGNVGLSSNDTSDSYAYCKVKYDDGTTEEYGKVEGDYAGGGTWWNGGKSFTISNDKTIVAYLVGGGHKKFSGSTTITVTFATYLQKG